MINITLELNRKCNFRCTYCYLKDKLDYEMTAETAKRSIDFAVKKYELDKDPKKEIGVNFIGGETLCSFPMIKKTISYINETYPDIKFVYSMTTNGSLINEDIVSFLIENDFYVKISLDGRREDNDLNRVWVSGKGTFDDVIKRFKYLNRYQIELNRGIQVNSVVTKNNYMNYADNLKFLVDEGGLRSIDLSINKGDVWSDEDLNSLAEVMEKALDYYMERNMNNVFFSWDFIEKAYKNHLRKGDKRLFKCGGGVSSFYIAWNGDIFMCPSCMEKEFVIGKVEDDLGGLWYSEIIKNKGLTKIDNQKCMACKYSDVCPTKGCFINSYTENGSIHQPSRISCFVTRMTAGLYQDHKTEIDEIMRRRDEYLKHSQS
ncbi:MAG: radical SAM protein [Clostridiales bacterium]|nr:radical SAM protein [Clostridiales bacterium]